MEHASAIIGESLKQFSVCSLPDNGVIAYTTCVWEMVLKFQLMRNLVQFANWAGWLSQTNHDEDFLDQKQAETRAFSDEFIRNFR